MLDSSGKIIDVLDSQSEIKSVGTQVSGSDLGTDSYVGTYYSGYLYIGSTSGTVSANGVTVYRYFKDYTTSKLDKVQLSNDYKTIVTAKSNITELSVGANSGITAIADSAFSGCTSLQSVKIANDTVKTIGENAFLNCSNIGLTKIILPYSVNKVGEHAFDGCTALNDITIKNVKAELAENSLNVLNIHGFTGSTADTYCKSKSKKLAAITDISDQFFKNEKIETFVIPKNVTSIGNEAFMNCSSLKTVSIESGSELEKIGNAAFYNTAVSEFTIPKKVKSVGNNSSTSSQVFADCVNLKKVTFEDGSECEYIGGEAFARTALTYGTNSALGKGTGSSEVLYIPENVKTLVGDAFLGSKSIKQITIAGMNTDITESTIPSDTVIGCHAGSEAYAFAIENNYKIALYTGYEEDEITAIEDQEYANNKNLYSVGFGPNITNIGTSAFENSTLTEICMDNKDSEVNINSIGKKAFLDNALLVSVKVQDKEKYSLSNIKEKAFSGCSILAVVDMPQNDSVVSVESRAFERCPKLTSVTIYNPNCKIVKEEGVFTETTTVKGWSNSTAFDYANDNSLAFNSIGTSYKIVFNKNGGTDGTDLVYAYDGIILPAISIPVFKGRTFKGYYVNDTQWFNEDGRSSIDEKLTISANMIGDSAPTAEWSVNKYTVSFDSNTGEGSMDAIEDISFIDSVVLPDNTFSKTGYTFTGWNTKEDGTGTNIKDGATISGLSDVDNDNVVLYAQYEANKYTVHFISTTDDSETVVPDDLNMVYDVSTTLPEFTGTKEYYTFTGWNTKEDRSGVHYDANADAMNIATEGTVNLYTEFTPVDYTISYDLDGGYLKQNVENPSIYNIESDFTLANPLKKGYEFKGWSGSDISGVNKNITIKNATGDRTYTANWGDKITYSLEYDLDGGQLNEGCSNPSTFDVDTDDFTLSNPVKTGYDFVGWQLEGEEDSVYTVKIETGSTGSRKYKALWKVAEYELTFDLKDGHYTTDDRLTGYTYGVGAELPTNVKKEGFIFLGWSTEAAADNVNITSISPTDTGDMTLYAVWDIRPNKRISLEYMDNDENITSVPDRCKYADFEDGDIGYVELPTKTEVYKRGYTLEGWYENADFTGDAVTVFAYDGSGDNDTKYFYGKFTPNTYDIAFETNGGEIKGEYNDYYVFGKEYKLPSELTKTGYVFAGWYTDKNCTGTKYTNVPKDQADKVTYYAKWVPGQYSVTLYLDNGVIIDGNVTAYNYGGSVKLPTNVVRDGCTFAGWYTKAGGNGEKVTEIGENSMGDVTYYAYWKPQSYYISYETNDGVINGNKPVKYLYNTETVLPANVTKKGYDFSGWYLSPYFSGAKVTKVSGTDYGNKTYFAKWTAKKYNVKYISSIPVSISSDNKTYIYGKGLSLPAFTSVNEKYFAGWYINSNYSGNRVSSVGKSESGDKVFHAKWSDKPVAATSTNSIAYVTNHITYVVNGTSATISRAPDKTSVTIPDTVKVNGKTVKVTSIKDNAFKNKKKLVKVKIGKNVKTVGKNAFYNCKALKTVTGGKNVKTIKANAFKKDGKLSKISVLGNTKLKTIGDSAFNGCKKLKKVTLGKSVTSLGKYTFRNCKNLKSISIKSAKIKKVGKNAFSGIYKKAKIKTPEKNYKTYKKLLKKKGQKKTVKISK